MINRIPADYLNQLKQQGGFSTLLQAGIISRTIAEYLDIYNYYQARMKSGWHKPNAIRETARQFKKPAHMVRRITRRMETV